MRLRELREAKKLTQKDVALYINKTPQAYSLYERGERDPDIETINKLAECFQVSTDYLLERTDTPALSSEQKNTLATVKNNDQDIHAEFVKFLIADGIIEKEEDITPEQVEIMREAFRSTMKILRPKA